MSGSCGQQPGQSPLQRGGRALRQVLTWQLGTGDVAGGGGRVMGSTMHACVCASGATHLAVLYLRRLRVAVERHCGAISSHLMV